MKKMSNIIMSITLLAVLVLVGCSGSDSPSSPAPAKVVTSFLDAIKNSDFEKAIQYTGNQDGDFLNNEEELPVFAQELFSKFTYSNVTEFIDGDTAYVGADITTVNMSTVMAEIIGEMIGYAFSGLPDEQIETMTEDLFRERINASDALMTTGSIEFELVKTDSQWIITPNDGLANVLTGGLIDYLEGMVF